MEGAPAARSAQHVHRVERVRLVEVKDLIIGQHAQKRGFPRLLGQPVDVDPGQPSQVDLTDHAGTKLVEPPADSPGGGHRILLDQATRFQCDQDIVCRALTQSGTPRNIADPERAGGCMQCIQDVDSVQNRFDQRRSAINLYCTA